MDSRPYATEGRTLKAYRIQAGITQRVLSTDTGIPLGTLQMYEQGRCRPSADRLIVIMDRLDVPAASLVLEIPA